MIRKRDSLTGRAVKSRFLTSESYQTIRQLLFEGESIRKIARNLGIPKSTVARWVQETKNQARRSRPHPRSEARSIPLHEEPISSQNPEPQPVAFDTDEPARFGDTRMFLPDGRIEIRRGGALAAVLAQGRQVKANRRAFAGLLSAQEDPAEKARVRALPGWLKNPWDRL